MRTEEKQLKVGDKIRIENSFNNYVVTIARVTKTQAITEPYNDAGAVHKFRRSYYDEYAKKIDSNKWSTTSYTIIKKK